MGFTADEAVTVDADITKYAFEQQISNLLRPAGSQTYLEIHKGAVNALIAQFLRPKGFTTAEKLASITNTEDFKPALTYWVLAKIFTGQGASARNQSDREAALAKADVYAREHRASLALLVIVTSDQKVRSRRGLVFVSNQDRGSRYPALGSRGGDLARGAQVAAGEIEGFENVVNEGK